MPGGYLITKPHCIVVYRPVPYNDNPPSRKGLNRITVEGELSKNSTRKLRTALKWLVASASDKQVYEKRYKGMVPWRINLGTLTFKENMQDDNKARRILSGWWEVAKYRWGIHTYVWKAEPQSRGAIHFHFCTGQYIPHSELRYTWNRALLKAGMSQVNANSTDIHAVTGVNNVEAYLSEYMSNDSKHEGRRLIKGKLWGSSQNLAMVNREKIYVSSSDVECLDNDLQKYSLRKRYIDEGKEVPEWLKFIDYYQVNDAFYKGLPPCEIKNLYMKCISDLQPVSCPELW